MFPALTRWANFCRASGAGSWRAGGAVEICGAEAAVDAFGVKDDSAARRASPKKSDGAPPHSILLVAGSQRKQVLRRFS
jgi:hypothetical protein